MYRLAIVETHPIQYKVPWFRALARHPEVDLTVFYCMIPDARQQGVGFGVEFKWDIPLLDGYRWVLLENVAQNPGVTHFSGCDTPSIGDALAGRLPTEHTDDTDASTGRGSAPLGERLPHCPKPCFDAVIVNGWLVKSCRQAVRACRRQGIPVIVRGESSDLEPRPWWKTVRHRWLLRRYDAFLAIGEANRAFYLRRGVRPERIFFGPYCVDNQWFRDHCPRSTRNTLRERRAITEGAVCFLFCGKFEPKKRPMDILRALKRTGAGRAPTEHTENTEGQRSGESRVESAGPGAMPTEFGPRTAGHGPRTTDHQLPTTDHGLRTFPLQPSPFSLQLSIHLLMVGDGDLRPECESFAREHRLPVTFTGFLNQTELPAAYAVADCLILPSDYGETWGLVVNEAMACGLPAITSDRVGCHPDLVLPGSTGAVFPFGDVAALAEVMRQFAVDPERLAAMGQAAREHVQRYSVETLVEGTLAAVRSVGRK